MSGILISNGDGIAASYGSLVAFARGEVDQLSRLVGRLESLADSDWLDVVRSITADIVNDGFENHPHIALATVDMQQPAAFVFGHLQLEVHTETGPVVLDGSQSSTWVDAPLPGDTITLSCGDAPGMGGLDGLLNRGAVPALSLIHISEPTRPY